MYSKYPTMFSKGNIGRLEVKNRIVMLPMSTNFVNENGGVTTELIDYYVERAKGGIGLIIVESAGVDFPKGRNGATKLRCDQVNFVPGLSKLVDGIHQYGAKTIIQVQHAGPSTSEEKTFGHQPVSPCLEKDASGRVLARELSVEEIRGIVQEFVKTAKYAKAAGFDGVEVHGAHSYLLARFLSPLTNKRTDEYGGSPANRARFITETIRSIRQEVGPAFTILVRINGDEFSEGGLRLQDVKEIAPLLEEAGADGIDVSSGLKNHAEGLSMYNPQGWRVYLSEAIKQSVGIPVIGSGVIRDPQFAEQALVKQQADFIGIARGLIADPDWSIKAARDEVDMIRPCILCNVGCASRRIGGLRAIKCSVNPDVGQEGKIPGYRANVRRKKRVVVVGAGPAGLCVALEAGKRGHEVTVLEKESEIGGLLRIGSVPFGKDILKSYVAYLGRAVAEYKIELRLNTEATLDRVGACSPDTVVLATGSQPLVPAGIPGIKNDFVLTAHDALKGRIRETGRKIVLVGGGAVGCETADYLAENNKVTLVEMCGGLAADLEKINRRALLDRLNRMRVEIKLETRLEAIETRGVVLKDQNGSHEIQSDYVVLAMGVVPVLPAWMAGIDEIGAEYYVVGDAQSPGRLIGAVSQGTALGRLV